MSVPPATVADLAWILCDLNTINLVTLAVGIHGPACLAVSIFSEHIMWLQELCLCDVVLAIAVTACQWSKT